MINSMIKIGGLLTDRILCDLKGAPTTLPIFYPDLYQFRLKIFDKDATGKIFQVFPNVTSVVSSMGLVYAEPRSGTFKLRYGTGVTTDAIDFTESSEDFRIKLAALAGSTTYGLDVVFQPTPSTWVMRFLTPGGIVPLNGYENELEPETFIRVRQFTQNAETWVEVRLLQGPVASTSEHDTVLPPPPTVRTIRDGYTDDNGLVEILVDEIQSITVPPDFTGTYTIRYQARESAALSVNSGPTDIQDALNNMYEDGLNRFIVTNPEANNAYIEFVGPFAGLNMDPLEINVTSVGSPDLFFQINLNTTEVAEALVKNPSVSAIFETRLHITDPNVPDDPGQDVILFQAPITISRTLHWEGLEDATPINWLFPPNPKDYIPFTLDQIIVGDLTYSTSFGDGILSDYVISHHLDSEALNVSVRENVDGGALLSHPEDYTVEFDDANALTVHINSGPPATNSLIVTIFSSGPVSAFLNHTHTIGQIVGLQAIIDGILLRLANLEAYLPSLIGLIHGASPFGTPADANIATITIANKWGVIPSNKPLTGPFDPESLNVPRAVLLPAATSGIPLGEFTADPSTDKITLATPATLTDGQRIIIDTPVFYDLAFCTFDYTTDIVTSAGHGLVNGRRVKFTSAILPEGISARTIYYVINSTTDTFQISIISGGPVNPLITNGFGPQKLWTISDLPSPLGGRDYFAYSPTSTQFQLSLTAPGLLPVVNITDAGHGPFTITTIEDLPDPLPSPDFRGEDSNAYTVRVPSLIIPGSRGIPQETLAAGDIVSTSGTMWYHVTRSGSFASNTYYPFAMDRELFTAVINENMLAPGSVFTVTFDLSLQMFKQTTNVQYVLVIEFAVIRDDSLLTDIKPGPSLSRVIWDTESPLLRQRIIVTDTLVKHQFGAQVIHLANGRLKTNKKLYGVEVAGDSIPESPEFGIRARLIEFDTEWDLLEVPNQFLDEFGLVYYSLEKAEAGITRGSPVPPSQSSLIL